MAALAPETRGAIRQMVRQGDGVLAIAAALGLQWQAVETEVAALREADDRAALAVEVSRHGGRPVLVAADSVEAERLWLATRRSFAVRIVPFAAAGSTAAPQDESGAPA